MRLKPESSGVHGSCRDGTVEDRPLNSGERMYIGLGGLIIIIILIVVLLVRRR
ncbi:MAG: hypothetical protein JO086_15115 [Acidimicrobiia bacterium]|nr:hypothetical protein [Acidimicrobiia bacterium]